MKKKKCDRQVKQLYTFNNVTWLKLGKYSTTEVEESAIYKLTILGIAKQALKKQASFPGRIMSGNHPGFNKGSLHDDE